MAQHIPIEQIAHPKIEAIAHSIRKQKYFATSMRFEDMPSDYNESPEDRVFATHRTVPASLVHGGRATFEVHTKPGKIGRDVTKIYMVA